MTTELHCPLVIAVICQTGKEQGAYVSFWVSLKTILQQKNAHAVHTAEKTAYHGAFVYKSAPYHAFTVSETRRQRVSFQSHRWVVGPEWVHCNKTHAKDRPHHDQSRHEMDPTYFSKNSFKQRSIKKKKN